MFPQIKSIVLRQLENSKDRVVLAFLVKYMDKFSELRIKIVVN